MTLFYRGPTAHITDELLEVWSPQHRVFRIGGLDHVYVVHGPGRSTGSVSLLAMAGAVVLTVALLRTGWWAALALAVLSLVGALAVAASLGAAPRPYELRAIYDGADVLLYRCTDAQTFGQVRRALARAIERHAEREWHARS